MSAFYYFELETRFAPQRLAILCHRDFRKCTRNVSIFMILSWKRASRHSGPQFFLSSLSSYPRARCFGKPTLRPNRRTNHWKNTARRHFPNISRASIFFLLTFAQLYLLSSDSTSLVCSAFQLSMLSEVRLLNFLWLFFTLLVCYSTILFLYCSLFATVWCPYTLLFFPLPVVPHKAVAEISRIGKV